MSTPDPFGAALDARAAQGSSASNDPYGDALARRSAGFEVTPEEPKSPEVTQGPLGFVNAAAETVGKGILNIPYTALHGAQDVIRRATGSDVNAPDSGVINALHVPLSPNAQNFVSSVGNVVMPGMDAASKEIGGNLTNDQKQGLTKIAPIAMDAAAMAPAVPLMRGGISGLRDLPQAPKPPISVTPQAALDAAISKSPTSMGAAAVAPNITNASQPLQSEIALVSKAGKVNQTALENQLKADEFGIQLTKGQATGDQAQIADEFNKRNEHPEFAQRKVDTNQKLIEGINDIKQDVAPAAAVDHEANAQTVIDAYKDKYAPIAADARAKWEKFQDAAGGALPIETGDFTTAVGAALKASGKTRYLPSEVAADIKDIDNGEAFTVERWDNLKTNLAGAQRAAERSGNTNAGLAVKAARDAVENYNFPNLDPQLQALNKEARSATAKKYAMLKADPAMDTAVNDGIPRGQLSPEAKGYMERYFLNGNKADLSNAQINLADNQDAKGAIAGAVTNELKKSAGIDLYRDDGNFSQAGYNKRLNELQPRIKFLMDSDSADKAFRLGDVARAATRQPTGAAFNNSGTSVTAHVVKRVGSGLVNLAETGANMATGKLKLGTGVREEAQKFAERKWVRESLKPGAGIGND